MLVRDRAKIIELNDQFRSTFQGGRVQMTPAVYELEAFNSLPRARRRDPDSVEESLRRAARSAIARAWNKKPICHVLVLTV